MLTGRDEHDCTTLDGPAESDLEDLNLTSLRIGVPKEFKHEKLKADSERVWESTITLLRAAGARIESISLPHAFYSVSCYHILNGCDAFSNMARLEPCLY